MLTYREQFLGAEELCLNDRDSCGSKISVAFDETLIKSYVIFEM